MKKGKNRESKEGRKEGKNGFRWECVWGGTGMI